MDETFDRVRKAAAGLPDLVEGKSYGTPALKRHKKMIARVKDADTLVLLCDPAQKSMLMETAPDIWFETDHYRGYPLVLARLSVISDAELELRLREAWMQATPAAKKSLPD